MDRLDSALKKIKNKKEMKEAAPLAAIGKGLAVAGKAIVKGGAKAAKAGAKGAKGATKVVNPKVMGGEVKKSAQIAKNVKPKSGPTIDVKATEVGGEIAKSKKATMASKSSTPKVKYGKSKGGEIQKSQKGDITNKGKNQVDPQKNPEADKPKEEPKDKETNKKKKKSDIDGMKKVRDTVGAVQDAYGKSSFAVKEQITFREWLDQLPVDEL
jgi:hypothetical protein